MKKVWAWFGKLFHGVKVHLAPIIVALFQSIKTAEDSGILDAAAKAIDAKTGHLAGDINAGLKKALPIALATSLGIENLPDSPTEADITTFENNVRKAVTDAGIKLSIPGQVWLDIGPKIYSHLQDVIGKANVANVAVTAQDMAGAIEDSYKDYQTEQQKIADEVGQADDTDTTT